MAHSLWYKDAIIYQAHVRSFFDSSNDGVGDFKGIAQKLDYLQALGITCLWLLPFFPSPLRDDGYDIAEYRNVHPDYGTLDDFKALVAAAHERHIRILIELVVNHTSDQHPWFERARHAPPGSPERNFYVWSDTDRKFPGTRIIFSDTEKSNWTFDPVAQQYFWHRFFSHQPDLNHNNPEVVGAIIEVMTFWFDLGVDAMRLDAVPYLCVRDGTSNENLPETHAVLKRMRRELDASYSDRMLLAEANGWPADVRAYFGEGDECHMAFHFPLMPRMFMAVRQEDRHAITEILNQTPDIPETCQWALFLRNHDELTLEMVTDEERDYMYQIYATDPQMRINGGIRRRLTPLLENHRLRVELLNALLFSLPGTPIVYYGDEIGMGDNIYLGDRNSVRTPMQWNEDRNGGFSRVDPARLFAPAIMDPVYGFHAVNVEAQERAPFSMLNWMRRLIALRKQHPVFGRGSLQFVGCANRKVLAYIRRDERETVLIAANLSSSVQPAELELDTFSGLTPIEMNGLASFPKIGEQPYPLTLGPYACYWFTLQQGAAQLTARAPDAQDPDATILESLPSLLIGLDWQGVLDAPTRLLLERRALIPFLERQPWCTGAATIVKATFSDWTMLRPGAHPGFLAIASVERADRSTARYFLPLALVPAEQAERFLKQCPGAVLARITGARKGAVVDGYHDDELCDRILRAVAAAEEVATAVGRISGLASTPGMDAAPGSKWTRPAGDHSNSVAIAGERQALKLVRRVEHGIHPGLEVGQFLASRRFTRTPDILGTLTYGQGAVEPATLAIVQKAVGHQGTGWTFTLDELRRYYERVAGRLPSGDHTAGARPFFESLEGWYLGCVATLGCRTAELHLALAEGTGPDFAPEPLTEPDLKALADEMHTCVNGALDRLAGQLAGLQEPVRERAESLLGHRARLLSCVDRVRALDAPGLRIRVHGDYHLGEVLRTEEDFVILDFDGDRALSFGQRRDKQSPLKDVAGMVRSFSYAAYVALLAAATQAPDRIAALEPWADEWQHWIPDAFLTAYRSTLGASRLAIPADGFEPLLCAFELEKAARELESELSSRPDWAWIPMKGMLMILERIERVRG